jgi:hypothetical protein
MSSLKDDQLVAVMRAVLKLPIEQRTVLLRHIATRLPMYISRFTDTDFDKAVRVVLREMMVRLALQRVAQHLGGLSGDQIRCATLPSAWTPWSVEELEVCFVVTSSAGQKLAYVCFEEEPGRQSPSKLLTREEARRVAANIAKLPELLLPKITEPVPMSPVGGKADLDRTSCDVRV